MAFIVPNANNTGGGQTYANTNQAEPDSLDFEILGNRSSWIRSGGNVTSANGTQVVIAGGTAVINGVPYTFSGTTVNVPNAASAELLRFDAIVVRLSGSSAAITRVSGLESSANPVLPQSKSTLGAGTFNAGLNVDFDTDVVLCTVFRSGTTPLTTSNVVDKRIVDTRPVTYASNSEPTYSTTPGVLGDRVIYNGVGYNYLTNASPTWYRDAMEATAEDAVPPIGSIISWAGTSGPPNSQVVSGPRYLPCNGQVLLKSDYPELYEVLLTQYGGVVDFNFNLPQINDNRTIYGVTQSLQENNVTLFGTSDGENTIKLTEEYMPRHSHTVLTNGGDNNHNAHTHPIDVMNNGTPGGSNKLLAANANVGTPDVRNTNLNTSGLNHNPQVSTYGRGTAEITPVPLKGKHINLTWYIRAK